MKYMKNKQGRLTFHFLFTKNWVFVYSFTKDSIWFTTSDSGKLRTDKLFSIEREYTRHRRAYNWSLIIGKFNLKWGRSEPYRELLGKLGL